MSKYFDYLEKIKGNILPFPNSAWPTEADVPLGVVVNDGGVIKQSRYVGNFLGTGCADFPQISVADKQVAEVYVDLDMTNLGSLQNFMGDNETGGDRFKSSVNGTMAFRDSGNSETAWMSGSSIQGRGRCQIKFSFTALGTVGLTIVDSVGFTDYGFITPPSTSMLLDCFGKGDVAQAGFTGIYYSSQIYKEGVLVMNQTPTVNDEFKESVSDTTTPPSGTGITTVKTLVPV